MYGEERVGHHIELRPWEALSIYHKDIILLSSSALGHHCPGSHVLLFLASFPQSSLVGVVVPDPEVLPSFVAKLGVKGSLEELCKNQVSLA